MESTNQQSETLFKTRFVDKLNQQCAQRLSGLVLRFAAGNPICEFAFARYTWTKEESDIYLESGRLPQSVHTLSGDTSFVGIWLFDAKHTGGLLPEVQVDVVPDFARHPVLCAFELGDNDEERTKIAIIPSEDLEMVPSGSNKVQFVLKGGRGAA